uniref:peptidylprolyl isomerase n=1 Tax=Helicotheca tamesis TaxID=374047 RepID=A0A7S2N1Q7_9STRA|mmetsp:Transcript_7760/g.10590  ORF Transcript_7760/g.10590 Transcript_7760/m.10590 type:complete len:418 (+) Transcript_7760:115-1368(+)
MSAVNATSCQYCYIDIDINNHRSKLALAAAFVDATDSRYGFSSKDLRKLGGSELSRVEDLISTDHEWSTKSNDIGIEIRPPTAGNRIIIKLYWDVAPLACENFATLCTNGGTGLGGSSSSKTNNNKKPKPAPIGESGKPLTYRNSTVHRVVPGFIMQGGDFVFGNGSGGESIYNGKKFKDEKSGLALKHDRMGIVSMGNSGKNSNTSQFFITFAKAPQCDGKHVVFGKVISGFEVLHAVEKVGVAEGGGGEPSVPVTITDCGVYNAIDTPGSGYWYDQPDEDSFVGYSPVFMVRPRVVVVAPTQAVYQKFQSAMGSNVTTTSIIVDEQGSDGDVVKQAFHLLESYAADVIVVAPVCASLLCSLELPSSWTEVEGCAEVDLSVQNVVIRAKPVEALTAIRIKSWVGIGTNWQLDGAMM